MRPIVMLLSLCSLARADLAVGQSANGLSCRLEQTTDGKIVAVLENQANRPFIFFNPFPVNIEIETSEALFVLNARVAGGKEHGVFISSAAPSFRKHDQWVGTLDCGFVAVPK